MVAAVVPAEAWGAAAARAAAVQDRAGPAVAQVLTPVAAEGCPVSCIHVIDNKTKKKIF